MVVPTTLAISLPALSLQCRLLLIHFFLPLPQLPQDFLLLGCCHLSLVAGLLQLTFGFLLPFGCLLLSSGLAMGRCQLVVIVGPICHSHSCLLTGDPLMVFFLFLVRALWYSFEWALLLLLEKLNLIGI